MTMTELPPNPEEKISGAQSLKRELFFWLQAMVFALVFIILLFTFVGRIIGVQGESMMSTLHNGDMLLLQSVGYQPKQGDIVVLTKESFMEEPIVKRIIAVEGQTVEIDYDAGTVRVDGQVLDEPYLNEAMERPAWETIDSVTVPEGSVFVMGDNRNHSSDSRVPQLGVVDQRHIIGRALFIVFPFSHWGAAH
jgi:signal peptidase I